VPVLPSFVKFLTKCVPPKIRNDQFKDAGDFKVQYVPPLADVYRNEGLPPALTFDKLSSGEQRALKEMGVAETIQTNEKVGFTTSTPSPR